MCTSQATAIDKRECLARRSAGRPGFTLIELLVVITIILIVSAVALPTVLPALSHRQVSEGARILQAALVGARDSAIKNNASSGIRLMPDPAFSGINSSLVLDPTLPLASNRIVPIAAAPDYSEGLLSILPPATLLRDFTDSTQVTYPVANADGSTGLYPYAPNVNGVGTTYGHVLTVVEQVVDPNTFLPNAPTSWFWNIRIGDRIQIANAGPWYTVVGPMVVTPSNGNNELFVNNGAPGKKSGLQYIYTTTGPMPQTITTNPEFLFLVNSVDDTVPKNGYVDEGWDGVNNNGNVDVNGNSLADELLEWLPESESWHGAIASELANQGALYSQQYTIRRRPAPTINAREVLLPTNVVVDLSTWGYPSTANPSLERSRLPVNPFTGYVDIMVNPRGDVVLSTLYSAPSVAGLSSSFLHFWLAERSDVYAPGQNSVNASYPPYLPLPQGVAPAAFNGAELKGEFRLITLFTRNGQVTTNDELPFDSATNIGTASYSTGIPFIQAQQGVRGGQ